MRKQEHLEEMLKASTNQKYLGDIAKQAALKFSKIKLEQDKKDFFLNSLQALVNYGSAPDAADEVLEFLENVCDSTYNLNDICWIHDEKVLFGHYEHFDAQDGEATHYKNKALELENKYSKSIKRKETSAHSLASVAYFREQIDGLY
jgi:hypothetical protein